ncbi:family 43 glycosylhydrolase [Sutcliffiella rhizosphaerae]|uniref:Endo-alpha-(1->5)-L-arabinanase n=1 Tax=Sutcliffiella rhizosphaerae TaxID=2880967 RepID=A0ABN8A7S0_9BACI|nr:family 43 glycosylhydrolase [Sutcliffiella rhizosphaerae]CAG9621104.1 Intracellular endo-alpha-(1->5)-L-arabinanase [Sutcliffiella rhizosphaerae]
MKKGWLGLILSAVLLLSVIGYLFMGDIFREKGPVYQNPVFEPVIADPSIVKGEDGFFYVYGTEDNWGDGMGSRIVPIVRSENLVDWEYVGEAFLEKPNWKEDGGIWAPDVSFFNGKYYMYYSQSTWGDANPAIGVAVSDVPEGPFEDKGKLFDSKEIGVNNSIDAQAFVDDDGTPYLFWGSWHGIWGIELAEDGLSYIGEKFQIASKDFEAAYMIKRDGLYYFFGSQGSCCEGQWSTYRVAVGKGESVRGPFYDKDGKDIVNSSGTLVLEGGERFVGPGHNAIVADDAGQDWIIYHAVDKEMPWIGSGTTRRPLMIDKIVWEDGWPTIADQQPGEGELEGPITGQ